MYLFSYKKECRSTEEFDLYGSIALPLVNGLRVTGLINELYVFHLHDIYVVYFNSTGERMGYYSQMNVRLRRGHENLQLVGSTCPGMRGVHAAVWS